MAVHYTYAAIEDDDNGPRGEFIWAQGHVILVDKATNASIDIGPIDAYLYFDTGHNLEQHAFFDELSYYKFTDSNYSGDPSTWKEFFLDDIANDGGLFLTRA